jgi:DNA polymerase III subunit beta
MNTTFQFNLNRTHLRAALHLAADRDIRYYLNGVSVEVYQDRTFIVATTGHVMGFFRAPEGHAGVGDGVQFVIPRDMVQTIKAVRGFDAVAVTFDPTTNALTLGTEGLDMVVSGKAVDGRFPEWRRVVATESSGEPAQFNPDLLPPFVKVAKLLGSKHSRVHLHHNGQAGMAVQIPGHEGVFAGVLMPIRADAGDLSAVKALAEAPRPRLQAAA